LIRELFGKGVRRIRHLRHPIFCEVQPCAKACEAGIDLNQGVRVGLNGADHTIG